MRKQLDDLVQTLYVERDKQRLQGAFLPGSVTVAVQGGEVLRGAAPLDLIVDRVKTLQSIFFRVAEWQRGKPLRRKGPAPRDVTDCFEPWLVQEAPGSFQFSVAVKVSGQQEIFGQHHLDAEILGRKFLDVVMTVASDVSGEDSKQLIPDDDYRATFRKLVRSLAPTDKSFDAVTLAAREHPDERIVLDDDTRSRLDSVLKREILGVIRSPDETLTELTGVLRALDLNSDWLKLDVEGKLVKVKGLSQAVDDLIGPLVNRSVVVSAISNPQGALTFVDIKLATGDSLPSPEDN